MVHRIVVMGVSGSGKSTVGELLAAQLGAGFVDADDLHPLTNVDKMSAGIPLTDDDRWPWLHDVGRALAEATGRGEGLVVACSALRRAYRDAITREAGETVFVLLDGSRELLTSRLARREGHFMPIALLDSQLATLEPLEADETGITQPIEGSPASIARAVAAQVASV